MIDWEDWDRLEPRKRDEGGDFVDADGNKIVDEADYHRRVRDPELFRRKMGRMVAKTKGGKKNVEVWPRSAWERLYYRWDDEANAVIRWAFTRARGHGQGEGQEQGQGPGQDSQDEQDLKGPPPHPVCPSGPNWWEQVDWDAREPVTILHPFMGDGTTVVEALRLGANVVGVDLNPVARPVREWCVLQDGALDRRGPGLGTGA